MLRLIGLIALAACLYVPARAGDNLVPSPSFGKDFAGWTTAWPNTEYYGEANAKRLKLVDDPKGDRGKVLMFDMPQGVGDVEGVMIASVMAPMERYAKYEFGVDVYSTGPPPIVFIECYVKDPDMTEAGPDLYPGYRRVYRATIHVKNAKGDWASQRREIDLSKKAERYQPDFVIIKLYAYLGAGKIYWQKPFVRQTAPPPADKATP